MLLAPVAARLVVKIRAHRHNWKGHTNSTTSRSRSSALLKTNSPHCRTLNTKEKKHMTRSMCRATCCACEMPKISTVKKQKENVRVPEPAGQRSPWRNRGLAGNTALEGTPRLRPHGTPSCSVSGWAAWCKRCARRPGWRCTRNAPATQTDRRCSLSLCFRFVHGEKLKALQLLHQIILYHSYQSPASKKDGSVCRNVALFSNSTLSCM